MKTNPKGVFAHIYVGAFAIVTALVFGAVWAFVPLALGFLLLLIAS